MINARRYRARIREVAFLICLISLVWVALPAASENAQEITKDQSALNQEKKQQERQLKRESFKSASGLLIKHGVPFDPDILLEPNWKEKLAPALKVMPEFREFREGEQKMAGVHLAHTLLLPEHVELTGDTVIIARQLIFSGKDVKIKGPYHLAFFPIDPIVTLESDFLKTTSVIGASHFVKAGFSTARLLAIAESGRYSQDRQALLSILTDSGVMSG